MGCSVFWVHASNTERFEEDYRAIADKAELPSELRGEDLFGRVAEWLAEQKDWLLVLDNVDDLDLFSVGFNDRNRQLDKQKSPELMRFVPTAQTGTVLFTTRDQSIRGRLVSPTQGIDANIMTENDALTMLRRLGGLSAEPERKAEQVKLVNTLEKLPLAIAQAAAYLLQYPEESIDSYIADILSGQLLGEEFYDVYRNSEVPNSVLRTWTMSMKKIAAISSASQRILNASAFFDNQGIPFEFLQHVLGPGTSTHSTMTAIGLLKRFSFLQPHQSQGQFSKSYQLHLLVGLAIRQGLTDGEKEEYSRQSINVLADLFPPDWQRREWTKCREYLPHALTVLSRRSSSPATTEAAVLLRGVARHYLELGELNAARSCVQQSLDMYRTLESPSSAGYLMTLRVLARAETQAGHYDLAESICKEVVNGRRAILGERDTQLWESLTDLAEVHYYLGQWDESERIVQGVLAFPVDPPDLGRSTTMNCLATVYYQKGRLEEAETLLADVVNIRTKLIGERHPETHLALANLAAVVSARQRWTEAETLERKVLVFRLETLGERHHDTLRAMANLAVTIGEQGRRQETVEIERKLLELRKMTLGPNHPDTMYAMRNLGVTIGRLGDIQEAERMSLEVLAMRRTILGNKHPDTIRSISDMAIHYALERRWEESIPLNEEALRYTEEVLGLEHPESVQIMANLAVALASVNRDEESAKWQAEVLRLRKAQSGDFDTQTIWAKASLSMTYSRLGRYREAEPLARQAMEARRETLGRRHPDTLHSTGDLAATLTQLGRWQEAGDLVKEATPLAEETYGVDHRVTKHMRNTLETSIQVEKNRVRLIQARQGTLMVADFQSRKPERGSKR